LRRGLRDLVILVTGRVTDIRVASLIERPLIVRQGLSLERRDKTLNDHREGHIRHGRRQFLTRRDGGGVLLGSHNDFSDSASKPLAVGVAAVSVAYRHDRG